MKLYVGLAALSFALSAEFTHAGAIASLGAPIAKAELTIDWASLTVTPVSAGLGTAPVLTWSNLSSAVNAYRTDVVSVGDWATPLAVRVGNFASFSESDVNAAMLHSYSEDNDIAADSGGGIWTLRTGEFSVVGSGSVLFSVNYAWEATLLPANQSPYANFAYVFATLEAETRYDGRCCQNRGDYDELNIQLVGSFSDIGSFQGQGSLEINVPVNDGDHFYFTVANDTTANVSAIPEPSTVWLFACGLMGVFGLARLRHQGSTVKGSGTVILSSRV